MLGATATAGSPGAPLARASPEEAGEELLQCRWRWLAVARPPRAEVEGLGVARTGAVERGASAARWRERRAARARPCHHRLAARRALVRVVQERDSRDRRSRAASPEPRLEGSLNTPKPASRTECRPQREWCPPLAA